MFEGDLEIEYMPELTESLFIAGFDGWGNALDTSWGMIDFLIRKLNAKPFGRINPDTYYSFDEKRPTIIVNNGILEKVDLPEAKFYFAREKISNRNIVIFKASEPSLKWIKFADTVLSICEKTSVSRIICIGSMYDNVLHTDTVISAVASSRELLETLENKSVSHTSYKGPGGIHSTFSYEAQKRGFDFINLWCHCPHYLQGTTHFGLLFHLANIISQLGEFPLETDELAVTWNEINRQIQDLISKNPELSSMIDDLKKNSYKGEKEETGTGEKQGKIIQFDNFRRPGK
jgi:predicted ATP-grasp superfamily ATP-dependent carboligase